ncbi:MAG: hypothetical protein ABI790_09875 [Betaproteobacteria bacterium]
MKKLLFIAAMGALALGTTSAMASPAVTAGNTLDVQEIRDSSPLNSRAAREAFKSVRDVYAMADGTTLALYQEGKSFVAEVRGQAPIEVLATRAGTFVAVNGAAELRFVQNAGGQVDNVVFTRVSQTS